MAVMDGVVTLLAGAACVVLVGVMHWWRSCPVDRVARRDAATMRRGYYSTRPVGSLRPPPSGPAPGARKAGDR